MKYPSLHELSKAYWRVKLRAIAAWFVALLLWCVLYGGSLTLIVRWTHPFSNWMMLPLALGFLAGGFTFAIAILYPLTRNWAIRCSHCNSPVNEFQEWEKNHGDVNPICQNCGESFIESDESTSRPDPEPREVDELEGQCKSL